MPREAGVRISMDGRGRWMDNVFIESLNGKFRAECLNAHWFMSHDDAVRKCEAWRKDYNEVRSHNAVGNKPPISLMLALAATWPALTPTGWKAASKAVQSRVATHEHYALTNHTVHSVGAGPSDVVRTFNVHPAII